MVEKRKAAEKAQQSARLSPLYLVKLAMRELAHNRISTITLIAIICFVSLPLLILGTVRERYLDHLIQTVELQSNARRIDFSITAYAGDQIKIDAALLSTMSAMPQTDQVYPVMSIALQTITRQQRIVDLVAEGVPADNAELKRGSASGTFSPDEYRSVILNKRQQGYFGTVAVGDTIAFFVTGTVDGRTYSYPLSCRIAGFVESGEAYKVYIPLSLAADLRAWTQGYGIARLGLPAAPDRSGMLGQALYPRLRLYLPSGLSGRDSTLLRTRAITLEPLDRAEQLSDLQGYRLQRSAGKPFNEGDDQDLEATFQASAAALVIPEADTVSVLVNGRKVVLRSTTLNDPLRGRELSAGRWLGFQDPLLTLVLPTGAAAVKGAAGRREKLQIGGMSMSVRVVGLARGENGYGSGELLYRLQQARDGWAFFDRDRGVFVPTEKWQSEKSYEYARLYVKRLRDLLPVLSWLKERGFKTQSQEDQVQNINRINRLITNLILLIGSTGLIAVILATSGVMFEAIYRKKKQIAILRTMGLQRKYIARLYTLEGMVYGISGYLLANLLQYLLALFADTPLVHQAMGLLVEGPVFNSSVWLRLLLGLVVIALSYLSSLLPARYASQVEPAAILSERA